MKRLESATHFAELLTHGKIVERTDGELGGARQTTRTAHHNRAIAARAMVKQVAALEARGYRVVHMPPPEHPRDAALEAALRADRDDPAPYLVYADWLQSRGSELGKLIVLDHERHTAEADAVRATLGLPDEDLATLEWRWGLWRSLRLNNARDHMDESFDAVALARPLFASAMCCALDELRLGIMRWDFDMTDVPAVIAEAARQPWAADLRSLDVGDCDDDIDMAHHVIGDVGAAISRAFPRLARLRVCSGDQSWRGQGETFGLSGLALPHVEALIVETCSLSAARLAAVLDAALPRLATLELWFGSANDVEPAQLADLAPLLAGSRHASVAHLGLRNSELADALAIAVPDSAIASRLVSLDLSMGTLGDTGAAELASRRARFTRLERLVVDDNFLSPAGLAMLRAAFGGIEVVSNAQKTPFDGDERYVTVGE